MLAIWRCAEVRLIRSGADRLVRRVFELVLDVKAGRVAREGRLFGVEVGDVVSAALAGRELVAGLAALDQTSHKPAATYRERREHVLASVAAHLRCGGGAVVRCVLGESPDHDEYEIDVDTTANGGTRRDPSRKVRVKPRSRERS